MSKILILGGSGFLGQHLVNKMQGSYDFSFTAHNSKDFSDRLTQIYKNLYKQTL